jgi:predicted RecB family nuclease
MVLIDQNITSFSASDLVNFTLCPCKVRFTLQNKTTGFPAFVEPDSGKIVQDKGKEHERKVLEMFREKYSSPVEIDLTGTFADRIKPTLDEICRGTDCIYQPAFSSLPFYGSPDFLVKTGMSPGKTALYEVYDAKLAKTTKPNFIFQLCLYSEMLEQIQGRMPERMHVITGAGKTENFRVRDFIYYFRAIKNYFLEFVKSNIEEEPYPCAHCDVCGFLKHCQSFWESADHLCLIAGIRRDQVNKMRKAGINTIGDFVNFRTKVKKIGESTFRKLQKQAELQHNKKSTGESFYVIRADDAMKKGLPILPTPDPNDMFFDMEGFPFFGERGLEYLFGIYYLEDGKPQFKYFKGLNYEGEKQAFIDAVKFMFDRKMKHPDAHIYHYNHYETTALKRLMTQYAACENEVDHLLRLNAFVDLFRIVQNSLIISEPSYSLKSIEVFYRGKRDDNVTTSMDSVVQFEKYLETEDESIMNDIIEYNKTDCESLKDLQDWLIEIRDEHNIQPLSVISINEPPELEDLPELEIIIEEWIKANRSNLSDDELSRLEVLMHFVRYYNREKKPGCWNVFAKDAMTGDELVDEIDSIGNVEVIESGPVKRSIYYHCRFPAQEIKGVEKPHFAISDLKYDLRDLKIDENNLTLSFTLGNKRTQPSNFFNLIPGWPLKDEVLEEALVNFIDTTFRCIVSDSNTCYKAGFDLLRKDFPDIPGVTKGERLLENDDVEIPELCELVERMEQTYLFIQGPPGAGKTYSASHLIAYLLKQGNKIAISAHSHKAINNLMLAVMDRLDEEKLRRNYTVIKKSTHVDNELSNRGITVVYNNTDIPSGVNLLGATAWTLCRDDFEKTFDYLFIDESGQVPLSNCLGMSTSCDNLVLLGDQMQLGSPIQAAHPGDSGNTILDYILKDTFVVPPEKGVFLSRTWRMHPDVCRFISDAIYDSKLHPVERTKNQILLLNDNLEGVIKPTGLSYIPVNHVGNSQSSEEEAEVILKLYKELLNSKYKDHSGKTKNLTTENILVVAPYNMQVNLLKKVLPNGARVGTVDKFQGQEAEVVFVSLATSSQDKLPRNFDFLYSRNRLNVAISRAKTKAILVFSPKLLTVNCNKTEDMKQVNVLCQAVEYAETKKFPSN